ncbi:MAG: efflux RND transporter periplasmic adaptor subunit [Planctomycetota bacterium]|nr:MAG: efflux RND transporter periplasmic adaptor subunit [Planctomycetota bacterium]
MSTQGAKRWLRWAGRGAVVAGLFVAVGVLILWLAGKFSAKVPTPTAATSSVEQAPEGQVVPVRMLRIPRTETAVGTVRAVHEATIGSKLLARVVEVDLKAGQKVSQGDVLLRLDDTDLRARLKQAEAAVASAEAAHTQAVADQRRFERLLKSNAVSRQQYEQAVTAVTSTAAELRRARETLNEVQATLDFATVRSPMDGIVVDKQVDAGDMVTPGQVLATLLDPSHMQLVASVRESLAHRLQVGQTIDVEFNNIDLECQGQISEIVPEAQSASRAFEVKVTGPCPEGVYSGMFARILIPLDKEDVLVIPQEAVQRVGQLEFASVVDDGRVLRRAIRTGRELDGNVEVLSGLRQDERIELPPAAASSSEASDG